MAQAVEAGMVWINSENVRHLPTPFGGVKASGIGRDGGDYSFDFYMETKNIAVALGDHKIQRIGDVTFITSPCTGEVGPRSGPGRGQAANEDYSARMNPSPGSPSAIRPSPFQGRVIDKAR